MNQNLNLAQLRLELNILNVDTWCWRSVIYSTEVWFSHQAGSCLLPLSQEQEPLGSAAPWKTSWRRACPAETSYHWTTCCTDAAQMELHTGRVNMLTHWLVSHHSIQHVNTKSTSEQTRQQNGYSGHLWHGACWKVFHLISKCVWLFHWLQGSDEDVISTTSLSSACFSNNTEVTEDRFYILLDYQFYVKHNNMYFVLD